MANLLSLWKKNHLILLGAIVLAVALLVPYKSQAVKEYTLLVLDEHDAPVPGVTIVRETKGGSLSELHETQTTDHQGNARFQARYDFDSVLFRAIRGIANVAGMVLTMGHSRRDVFITISSRPTSTHDGSFGFAGFYGSDQPPTELVIKRRDATDPDQEHPGSGSSRSTIRTNRSGR